MFDLAEVAAEDRTGWSAAARSARVLELLEVQEQVRAEVIRCVGEWDADLAWAADGARSPASWLVRHARTTAAEARELVRAGRLVQSNTATAKALTAGDISSSHVAIAARAARHVEDVYAEHEDVILDAARALSAQDFRTAAAHWRSIADDVVGREPPEHRFDRRHLTITDAFDDMAMIDGLVSRDTAARLGAQLDVIEPPDPADGPISPRPLGVRRADAFERWVDDGDTPSVTVFAIADIDSLEQRMPADLTTGRCEIVGEGSVSLATMQRLLCDCSVSRVLMRGTSVVLDLGRATPVVSESQRRALAVRDGGCTEPGCDAPPQWCDAHHKVHWTRGGPTDLDNLELRCRRHHVAAHRNRRGPPASLAA